MNRIGKPGKNKLLDWRGYLVAIVAVALATWLKYLAQPNIIPADVPILYLLAIVPTATFFGFGPSIIVCILSVLAYDFFFIPPLNHLTFNILEAPIVAIFLIVGILFSYLASNLRQKNLIADQEITARKQSEAELVEYKNHLEDIVKQRTTELEKANLDLQNEIIRCKGTEDALRESEQRWATTLASIGDAVIATDVTGKITFMNSIAEVLTGWTLREASDKPIIEVFYIINEYTRQKVDNPVAKVLQQGTIVGLANHTVLVRKDRSEIAIDDSGAPIKDEEGKITGAVLIFRDITKRRQLEEALSYERDKLSNILNSMEDGVYIVNQDYDIEYINPALESFLGTIKGQKCYQYFHNQPHVCSWCKNLEIFQGQHVHWELRFSKTGRVYDMIGTPLKNPDGRILVQEILHDITERKQAEEALQQSEDRLKRSQEIAHLGSWELDLVNNCLSWSDEVYRIFGLEPQEFGATYEAFLEAVHPDDRAAVDAAYSSSVKEGRDTYEIEHRVIRKSTGEIRYVHEKCQHVRDESNKIIRSIGMVHDITEYKRADEALRASEKRYRSYIEVTGELGWTTNADGEVAEDIPSFRQFTGQSYEEVKDWGWSKALHPDDLENTIRVWKKAVQKKSSYETEYRLRRHDGLYRYFLARGVPILEEDGSIREWVGTCIDITERKQNEEAIKEINSELNLRAAELEAANKELEAFSYSVSHDLRAPLRSLDGFSEAVIQYYGDKLDETGKDYLNRVRKASQTMSQLIDDMLKLSRINRAEMHKDVINLSDLARSIADELQATQPDRQAEFMIAPDVKVSGDRQLLQILMRNLLENSWKYTGKCPNTRIEFGIVNRDNKKVYFIKDNGAGFNMLYANKLFHPFQRLHSNQEYPGTGIGLAIVQRVIARHGGEIWAESEIGKGATFYFILE